MEVAINNFNHYVNDNRETFDITSLINIKKEYQKKLFYFAKLVDIPLQCVWKEVQDGKLTPKPFKHDAKTNIRHFKIPLVKKNNL